jgi:hypothetical protein
MAYTTLTAAEIASGKPTKTELFTKIKNNEDDHESRLSDVETAATSTQPLQFQIVDEGAVSDAVAYIRVPYNVTISSVKVKVFNAGTAGTLDVDVQGKHGAGAFATILSGGNVTVGFGSGSFFEATSAGIADDEFDTGDILRLDLDGIQTNMIGAVVSIIHTIRS